ncbi:hypothetical protein GQ44DRAFT_754759 [Phaeosphaeriaceae sp. PMI808]|nr:hypothetical protein GQ44DRAFT_754759 [Phaeosphaeriaceae sp. PMI808]
MRHYSATAVALLSASTLAIAQECPAGYAKAGQVGWVKCGTTGNPELQCGTLEVPLDWTTPTSGQKLKLRLVRQPAAGNAKNAKSIISKSVLVMATEEKLNPGGPGESGIKSVVDGGTSYHDVIGTGYHIIGFDPRGVGLTTPYTCPKEGGDAGSYDTDDNLSTAIKFNSMQAKTCADAKYGSDLIGTAFVARDIKAISEALGEDGLIRYWGYSYGTLLGATLAAMFPKQVDRVILDGNINPTDYYRGLGEEGSADFDKGVARFFEQCAEAGPSNCAVAVGKQSGKQLQATFDNFLTKIDYDASFALRDAFFKALYDPSTFKAYATKLSGWYKSPSTISKRSFGKRQLDWKPDAATVSTPIALSGISCGDVVQRFAGSVANYKKWLALYEKTSKYGGDQAIINLFGCSVWVANAKEKFTGSFSNIETKTPILFLNTQYDPVTPLISAQNSAMGFKNARVLVSSGLGHCTTANESPDLNKEVAKYMLTGEITKENKVYAPSNTNVFKTPKSKRTLNGPTLFNRDVEMPTFFDNLPVVVKRADDIPAGCTKIAASSTPVPSSIPVVSRTSSMIISASASSVVSQASSSAAVSSSGSVSSSVGSVVSPAASSASIAPVVSGSSSVPAGSSSALTGSPSFATGSSSSAGSLAATIVGSAFIASGSDVASALASPAGSAANVYPTSVAVNGGYPTTGPSNTQIYGNGNNNSYAVSSAGPSYNNGYGSAQSSYAAGYQAVNSAYNGNNQYDNSNQATVTPCPSGYIPITSTYIKTMVQTITACNRYDNNCPVNAYTPTVTITKTQTATTIFNVPTTTAYTTTIVDVCSTGLTTKTVTYTQTCNSGCYGTPAKPTGGIQQGFTTTVKYCDACATPSTVTVTYCTACDSKPTVTPSVNKPDTPIMVPGSPLSQPASPPKASAPPSNGYPGSPLSQAPSPPQVSSPPGNGSPGVVKPSVPVYDSPPAKPSAPVVGASSVRVWYSTPTGSYGCTGSNCTSPSTTYKPKEFTGAATRPNSPIFFVTLASFFAGVIFLL